MNSQITQTHLEEISAFSNTYQVEESNIEELEAEVSKANRKAVKLGLEELTIEVGTSKLVEINDGISVKVFEVTVTGKAPQLNGYVFAGILQHNESGNIIRSLIDGNVPTRYRTTEADCEHCELKRNRNDTYLVKNGNEWLQVGSTCIKDFVGDTVDPQALAAYLDCLFEIEDSYKDTPDDKDLDDDEDFGGGMVHYNTLKFLSNVAQMISNDGWKSRKKAYDEFDVISTADHVMKLMKEKRTKKAPIEKMHRETAKNALEWIRGDVDKNSDYTWNLTVACSEDTITWRETGLVASLIVTYKNEVEKRLKAESDTSVYVGEIKKRSKFKGLLCTLVKSFDTMYGTSHLHKFNDSDGNELVWFSSSKKLEQGKVYGGKATVKSHQIYNCVKQTTLTRCKFN